MHAPGFRWLGLRLFCMAGVGQCALPRGTDVRPGVPLASRGSAGVPGSPPLLCGRCGTMYTVKGTDVRPGGVPLASLGLRLFCVVAVGQCALPRGRMYAPGVPLASLGLRLLGCPRRRTMCIAKASDARTGVPLASLGLRLFCVPGVGQCALPRGRIYAPGFRWLGLRLFCVAAVEQCALARGRMYAPGFRWCPWVSASFVS